MASIKRNKSMWNVVESHLGESSNSEGFTRCLSLNVEKVPHRFLLNTCVSQLVALF